MDGHSDEQLLPMTIMDGMILLIGCAVSAWLVHSFGTSEYVQLRHPRDWVDWLVLTAAIPYGPTVVCPVLLGRQFARGRGRRLFPGEIAWLVIALELLPFGLFGPTALAGWYMDVWLPWGSPPLVIVCALAAWLLHVRTGQPRFWLHRLGLAAVTAQCLPAGIGMYGWFQ